jgi:uncharacterized membrane protein YoaK (UPF0700 family)
MTLGLTDTRSPAGANVPLGAVLCFVAGAINAGGFLAVGMYTSHMSGVVSAMADNLVLGRWLLVWIGFGSLMAFVGGAVTTTGGGDNSDAAAAAATLRMAAADAAQVRPLDFDH